MPRSLWTGTVTFGLVNVPVRLYTATESKTVHFHEVHVKDGRTFVTITDNRPDAPRNRPHRESGTVFEVPTEKLKWDRGNPTGHGVLFLSAVGYVFCYVQPGGA